MGESALQAIEVVTLLILCSVLVFAAVAKRLNTPYPIVLMVAGLGLALLPGVPRVYLNPELVFLVVLPPLLYSAAWQTSWREFKFNLFSILLLAFGLVGFTVFGVAFLAPKLLPAFTWTAAFVLGAVVSTTDAIAATSIGRKLGLPQRLMDLLEGESLVNDASGLLALEFGTAMLLRGELPAIGFAAWRLAYLVGVGIGIGLLTGWVIDKLERYIDDGPVEIGISFLVPYGLYLAADAAHASGVLAVVAAGLYLSRKSSSFFSPQVRLQAVAVWETLIFLMNGFVFVLMGLQLPYILQEVRGISFWQLLAYGVGFSLMLVILRVVWVYPGAYAARFFRHFVQHQEWAPLPAGQVFIIGWTGMRGVVALAAAFSLPRTFGDGQPFPQRNTIIFLTYVVIFMTLVAQGLTLPALIRRLRVSGPAGPNCEEEEARSIVLNAALKRLEKIRDDDSPEFAPVYDDLERRYRLRLFSATGQTKKIGGDAGQQIERFRSTSNAMRSTERETAIRLRDEQRINDELLGRIIRELDLVDSRVGLGDRPNT